MCRVNTFSAKVKVAEGVYHPVHEYRDTVRNIYNDDFLHSAEYRSLLEEHDRDSISFSKFKEGAFMCPCIRSPKSRVCVDEVETGFSELTKCLENLLRQHSVTEYDCCSACAAESVKKELNPEGAALYVLAPLIHVLIYNVVYIYLYCQNMSIHCLVQWQC
jgi:hypothetical protein